jgi:Protein of unknown function (DUF3106)
MVVALRWHLLTAKATKTSQSTPRKNMQTRYDIIGELLLAGTILVTPALAQKHQPPPSRPQPRAERHEERQAARPPAHHAGEWLRQYKGAPPDQQRKALENDPQFRNLPPERQQRLRDRLQRFNNLPPRQQDRILNRMETWEHLTPQQKQQARQVFGQLQQLPPDRRRMVGTAIRDLRAMPPEQRQKVIDSDRFRGMFSPQERDLLNDATRLPLAPAENQNDRGPEE